MPLITITSDFGLGSTYQAAITGHIYSSIPNAQVVIITNTIEKFNVIQAAFLLQSNYQYFPKGTWHFICVETNLTRYQQLLLVQYNDHYFIGADNGIFSMLFDNPTLVYKINLPKNIPSQLFVEKDVFVSVVKHFNQFGNLKGITEPGVISNQKHHLRAIKEKNFLRGLIVFIDGYGNAITNISKEEFLDFVEDKKFRIYYSKRYSISKVKNNYEFDNEGQEIAIFNYSGFVQISVNQGSANQLLGLKFGSPITVEKYD